jgi:hypothetical protein
MRIWERELSGLLDVTTHARGQRSQPTVCQTLAPSFVKALTFTTSTSYREAPALHCLLLSKRAHHTMKDATSESPRSVTGRSPRIKVPSIARKDDAELSRAEQIAAMKEYTMYQRIMSHRLPQAASLPPPACPPTSWNNAASTSFKGGFARPAPERSHFQDGELESGQGASNDADLEGIFEMDL